MIDPIKFKNMCWPDVTFYKEQKEIIYSVRDNDETVVPAGNMLGKDFVSGFIAVWYFMACKTVRIITTSVKDDHLRVLWGEIGRFIGTSEHPFSVTHGGPWIINHREIKKLVKGELCKISYMIGQVSATGEGISGHHAERTLLIIDEASGVDHRVYDYGCTWAQKEGGRVLIIGNPNPCENFFKWAVKGRPGSKVKGGNLAKNSRESTTIDPVTGLAPCDVRAGGEGYIRRIIKIKAEHSPNVRLGVAEIKAGKKPSNRMLVPGVKTYGTYLRNRRLWDDVRQCVGLDAEFYEGAKALLFPPDRLDRAERIAKDLNPNRPGKAIGIDPAEGGDKTSMTCVDAQGIIEQVARKTPDTSEITGEAIAFMQRHNVKPEDVLFDAGGGGKQHADRLRKQGYKVRAIAFGGGATPDKKRGMTILETRKMEDETRYIYKNRRAEMYGLFSLLLDPAYNPDGFGIPEEYYELRRQLAVLPLRYDGEGRLWLPPKNKKKADSEEECLIDILGCSPDEADSTVLATFGLTERGKPVQLQVL